MRKCIRPQLLSMCVAVATLVTASMPAQGQRPAKHVPKFYGQVYDLDFLSNQNWVQVAIRKGAEASLVAQTSNPQLQDVLQTALMLGKPVAVDYVPAGNDPVKLNFVALAIDKRPAKDGEVTELDYDQDVGFASATVWQGGKTVTVITKDARALGILTTAVRQAIPVQYLTFDPSTKEITRVKVNVAGP